MVKGKTGSLEKTLASVLKEIKPTQREQDDTARVLERVKTAAGLAIAGKDLSLTIAGSYVRNTWMRDKKEFDLFILFPEYYSRDDLEKMGLELGKAIVKKLKGTFKIAYAEHPYTRARVLGYDVDIVPCFNVESAAKIRSAVDRTPFHNQWLSKNLSPHQADDVRLFKQFCKGQGIYGSDTKMQGLSGYLCELLIVRYGDFASLMKEVAQWKPGVFIDLENHHAGGQEKISKRFESDPLIVIDPVDPKRNVAAALSPKNFTKLAIAAKELLEKPTRSFFFKPVNKTNVSAITSKIKRRGTLLLAIAFRRPDIIDDVLWPQLRKASERMKNILAEYEFELVGRDAWADEKTCVLFFEFKVWKLPGVRRIEGPEIFRTDRVKEFRNKYFKLGKVFVEGDRWFAEIKRDFTDADVKIKDSLSDPLKGLLAKGIPSYVAKAASRNYSLWNEKEIVRFARDNVGFSGFLFEYFEK